MIFYLSDGNYQLEEKKSALKSFGKLVDEKREFVRIGNEWFRMDANWMAKFEN